ncbi:MAG: DUF1501 domain-containing protein, partial [Planctomycetes bacterium]|nr:DUF1501 domain-containing protein [Planctomycetota bacterium]
MLQIQNGAAKKNCQGITRRTALKAGFCGLLGLSLADMLKLQSRGNDVSRKKSVILMWLDGGPSHMETYDPKPEAPTEYRGPYGVINTNVAGIRIADILPRHARHADKMVFIRSMHHDNGDHFAGGHWMLTGRFGSNAANLPQMYPSFGSYIARCIGPNQPGLPAYVGLPSAQSIYLFPGYMGAAYLGAQYNPFDVDTQARYLAANSNIRIGSPQRLQNLLRTQPTVMQERMSLMRSLDTMRRDVDRSGVMESMDRYQQQAVDLITSPRARDAFDIDREDPRLSDRYGLGPWGRYTLMARRLVEAGVTFVTVDMPHWDDHSNIKDGHGCKLPHVDRAVGGLLEDLQERGMLDDVLLIVMGEFGRTPRINTGQPGIPIPGRDHWGNGFSVLLAGGGLRTG